MKKKIEQDPRRALNTDLIGDDRLNKLSAYLHLSTPCSDPRARPDPQSDFISAAEERNDFG